MKKNKEQRVVTIYTESTPNPEAMKFVVDKMLLLNDQVNFQDEESAKDVPLVLELFGFPFVKSVFVSQNYIAITKQANEEWEDIIPSLKAYIKDFFANGKDPKISGSKPVEYTPPKNDEEKIVAQIKVILDNRIRPAVEMDGGAIKFISFENGIVTVQLQGACSGCPSASVTLKAGIEALLKKTIPEVKEVVAQAEYH